MSLSTSTNRVVATGDGVSVTFNYNRLLYDATHLKVYLAGVLQTTGYTVNGVPGTSTSVTFSVAPTNGVQVLLLGEVPLTQLSDFDVGGAFPAESVEKSLDLTVMGLQQFDEVLDRAITLPVSSTLTAANLPDPALAANYGKGIKIKNDGTGLDTFTINAGDIAGVLTTKGDILVYSAAVDRLPVGLNHLILTARSSAGAGVAWRDQINVGAIKFEDATDSSKTLALALPNLSASTTRTLYVNDENGTIGQGWDVKNLSITATVGANALTIALKTRAGTDASATNPIYFKFRNATAGTGDYTTVALTAAHSLAVSSGSTLGTVSAVAHRLYVGVANDGGTLRLFVYNPLNGTTLSLLALNDSELYSSTAEGGIGAADSAQVLYSGTAFSTKAIRVLGYVESTQATAGTWATTPSKIHLLSSGDKRTGDIVQVQQNITGAVATGTTNIPIDDTIPQITEGVEYMTQAITPTSAVNVLKVMTKGLFSAGASGDISMALFRDAVADALAAIYRTADASSVTQFGTTHVIEYAVRADATTASTFRVRAGGTGGATITFNGQAGARKFGGTMNSSITVTEIMV